MVYLASPYSHPKPEVQEQRFKDVCQVAAKLMAKGMMIFSPIAHTHPIAAMGDLPKDWKFWEKYDREMLLGCGQLIVLTLDGWAESKGVAAEVEIAKSTGVPVSYMDPKEHL